MKIILIVAVIPHLYVVLSLNCSDVKYQCQSKTKCGECIREHHCCHWCYSKEDLKIPRCNTLEELQERCNGQIEENAMSNSKIKSDEDFTEITSVNENFDKIIQLKPQQFDVVLRKDIPINLTFTYKAAKNYPLDLYYLGDLSYSMLAHLDTMKSLGSDLSHSLKTLTENYRLAYGSFMDKPALPFYYTDPINYKNPCRFQQRTCEQGYLFKHRLDFTPEIGEFFEQVNKSNITANVDNLDGALDAILQLLICENRIKWSQYSRKLIFLATDSYLHTAGDGLLSGSVKKNLGECMIDSNGDYTDPLEYDYPDPGEILLLLRRNKVNVIVATKDTKINYFKHLKEELLKDHMYIGQLEENSTNILQLVGTGFTNFMNQVQFFVNTSEARELDVKFFGKCLGEEEFNQTSFCYNVEEEKPLTFKVQLTLKDDSVKNQNVIHVKEKNINEQITINLRYVGYSCNCENYSGDTISCDHGEFQCGDCLCDLGWKGTNCNDECDEDNSGCRFQQKDGSLSATCDGHGHCACGTCECEPPYSGAYCEYYCPLNVDTRKICSGEDHGKCLEGKCVCEDAFQGEDCSCETSTEECGLVKDGILCNNKGVCKCNRCVCDEEFDGKYCERTGEGNMFCSRYDELIQDYAENKTDKFTKDQTQILVKTEIISCDSPCQVITYEGTTRCVTKYCYERKENLIHLHVVDVSCVLSATAVSTGIALGLFAAIVLAGLAFIGLKKYRIHVADLAEYQRFEKNRMKGMLHENQNPIYNSPVREYRNPLGTDGTEMKQL